MKTATVLFAIIAGGCAPYANIKLRLGEHAGQAIDRVELAAVQRQQLIESFYTSGRSRLAAGFDADVRQRDILTADWVIEARKAYSLAVDAIHQQQAASGRAHEAMLTNLRAARECVQQLNALSRIESRLDLLQQEQP